MKIVMPDIMKVECNTRLLQEAKSLRKYGHKVEIVGFSNQAGYNTHSIKPLVRRKLFHEELGLTSERVVILFQGGFWGKGRGIKELIEAARHIDDNAAIVFQGFGSPQMIDMMKSQIRNKYLKRKVHIAPPQPPVKSSNIPCQQISV